MLLSQILESIFLLGCKLCLFGSCLRWGIASVSATPPHPLPQLALVTVPSPLVVSLLFGPIYCKPYATHPLVEGSQLSSSQKRHRRRELMVYHIAIVFSPQPSLPPLPLSPLPSPPPRLSKNVQGILARAGSSIRQLFGGGGGAVAAAPASAPEDKCNTINRFRSSPSSPATTTATPTRIPSQLLSSTPIPAAATGATTGAATGAAAAGGPAMATPAPMHNGETHNNDSVMHSSGVSQVAAEGGRPGQSQSEEGAWVGRVLDTSKEGGEDSGVGGGGKDVGQRGKKAGFSCCACLQVCMFVCVRAPVCCCCCC